MDWDYTLGSLIGLFSLALMYVMIKIVWEILDRITNLVVISKAVEETPELKAEFMKHQTKHE
jgi:hypothetical protein